MEQPQILDIAGLNLKPGSILVAHVPEDYTLENMNELSEMLHALLKEDGLDNTILVLPATTTLSVIDTEESEEAV